jgi:hypothetical protein
MIYTSRCAKSLGPAKAIVNVKAEVAGVATETMLPPAIQELATLASRLKNAQLERWRQRKLALGRTIGTPRDQGCRQARVQSWPRWPGESPEDHELGKKLVQGNVTLAGSEEAT